MPVRVLDHPLAGHLVAHLRDRTTKPATFRTLAHQLTTLLAIEATRDLETEEREIATPLETTRARVLGRQPLVVVPVLRAGLGMVQPFTDLFPDVSFPIVAITTTYPGAGPAEIEEQVSKPIEDAISTINGVDVVRSFSRDSVSVVIVQFALDANELEANADARDRLQQVRAQLPDSAKDPVLQKFDPSAAPIMTYAVRASRSSRESRG